MANDHGSSDPSTWDPALDAVTAAPDHHKVLFENDQLRVLEVTLEPNGSTREVMIDRVVHLGFNVRLDLVGTDGERLSVQTTRDNAELNEFAPGQIVYVKPTRHTTFT